MRSVTLSIDVATDQGALTKTFEEVAKFAAEAAGILEAKETDTTVAYDGTKLVVVIAAVE